MSADTPITTDALTAILHKRAESKLRKEIEKIVPTPSYYDPLYTHVKLPPHIVTKLKSNLNEEKQWLPVLLQVAQEGLYAAQVEEARAREVTDFLAKVETTADELNAIREEMCQ